MREIIKYVLRFRRTDAPFDIAQIGDTPGKSLEQDAEIVAAYAEAGATWWLEAITPSRQSPDSASARIRRGPPALRT
jgi:hypothetical protein